MGKSSVVRVYPSEGSWIVKKDGNVKASAVTDTKLEAVRKAKEIANDHHLRLIIHGRDGKIQENISPNQSKDDCFITTACVKYYGLQDNCYELQTLRRYRDTYLLKSEENACLVHKYYSVAPQLVKLLEADSDRHILFAMVYSNVRSSCLAIERKQFEKAKRIYLAAVEDLMTYFNKALHGG
jgi:hypothetical protein